MIRYGGGRAPHHRSSLRATVTARSWSSSMAAIGRRSTARSSAISPRGLNAHGIDVAIPSYDLCPDVSVGDIIGRCARRRANWRGSGGRWSSAAIPPAGISPPACWRPTGAALDPSLPQDLVTCGLRDLRPVRSGPLVGPRSTRRLKPRRRVGAGGKPAVLEAARARQPRCRGRRRRERRIFPAEPNHRRGLGRGRRRRRGSARFPAPTISPRSRRSPIPGRRWCRGCGSWPAR